MRAGVYGAARRRHARRNWPTDYGTFTDNFNRSGPALGNGWTDGNAMHPVEQDPMGLYDNGIGPVASLGPPHNSAQPLQSGTRGVIFRKTGFADNVSVTADSVPALGSGGGSGVVHYNPVGQHVGIGAWYNWVFGYWEIGYIGRNPFNFSYMDTCWTGSYTPPITMELRSKGGEVALYANGTHVAGKVAIPSTLINSPFHGLQVDYGTTGVQTNMVDNLTIADAPGGALPSYSEPTLQSVGAFAKPTGTGTTLILDYPSGIVSGDLVMAIIASGSTSNWTATGWSNPATTTHFTNGTSPDRRLSVLYRFATGSLSGTETFTKGGSADLRAGAILRLSPVQQFQPITYTGQANTASTTLRAPSHNLIGQHRTLIWAGMALADTPVTIPASWTNVGATAAGGESIVLAVARRSADASWSSPYDVAFNGTPTGVQDGTLGASNASIGVHLQTSAAPVLS